jgi:hypothetical protein
MAIAIHIMAITAHIGTMAGTVPVIVDIGGN